MIKEIDETKRPKICDFLSNFGSIIPTFESYDHYYVFEENQVWISFAYFQIFYERAELLYLYVNENDRNLGYGTKFLKSLLDKMNHLGVEEITLEVNVQNEQAIHLYKKCGFEIVRTIKNYYQNQDGYMMYRKL